VGFVVDKVALGQVFSEYFGFPLSVSFHWCSITRKNEKKRIIFITGLHNKPQGCGASVASAAGSYTTKKKSRLVLVAWRDDTSSINRRSGYFAMTLSCGILYLVTRLFLHNSIAGVSMLTAVQHVKVGMV
jgi:hypothetical protein